MWRVLESQSLSLSHLGWNHVGTALLTVLYELHDQVCHLNTNNWLLVIQFMIKTYMYSDSYETQTKSVENIIQDCI